MALKALSKDEDLAAVPSDQPVLVQLPGFDDEPDAKTDKDKQPDLKVIEKTDDDPGVKTLKEQLEALRLANEASNKRADESDRRAQKADRDRLAAIADKTETESDAVTSGLAAAQAEQIAAKAALKAAGESGDWDAMGDAQARIARSASDIREFERAAAQLADDKKRQPTDDQQRDAPQRQMSVNEAIDSNPKLLETERVWLKAHPEAILDPARNKELDVAYVRATRDGLSRGTLAYFDYIEKFMGYKTGAKQEDNDMDVSAPPSRNERGGDGKPTGGKIMLTPEERDLAKSMGVTDIEYARQKVNFDSARKNDPEKYR